MIRQSGCIDRPPRDIRKSCINGNCLAPHIRRMGNIKAIKEFEKLINKLCDVESYWKYLGDAYQESGNHDMAIELFEKLIAEDYPGKEYRMLLGSVYLAKGDTENAREYDESTEVFDKVFLWSYLGKVYETKGDYDEAIHVYERAIDKDPTMFKYKEWFSDACVAKRDFDRAIVFWEGILTESPDSLGGWRYLADVYRAKGDIDGIIKTSLEAIEKNPQQAHLFWKNVGDEYASMGNDKQAIETYGELIKALNEKKLQNPFGYMFNESATVLYRLGLLYEKQDCLGQAIQRLQDAAGMRSNIMISGFEEVSPETIYQDLARMRQIREEILASSPQAGE
jgi:tetratricopeptide (TPR) repeat protein